MVGSALVESLTGMSLEARERAIVGEFLSGNVPSFSRKLRSIERSLNVHGKKYKLLFFSSCDYLAIGSDQDYLYVPLTPSTAQHLADTLGCLLPTKMMVDEIYTNSEIKLIPQPIPPSDTMTSIPVFAQHTDSIKNQISLVGLDRSAPFIIAGHKKDIIISNEIFNPSRKEGCVVIYGWHLCENNPIQPVYSGHFARYADYSHGVRFISNEAFINGAQISLRDILKDPLLYALLSSEGIISKPYYPQRKLLLK